MTADGRRLRTGGGILWNIMKTREPMAYKEIMKKAKDFEVCNNIPKNISRPYHLCRLVQCDFPLIFICPCECFIFYVSILLVSANCIHSLQALSFWLF